jgi:hypothetical protein
MSTSCDNDETKKLIQDAILGLEAKIAAEDAEREQVRKSLFKQPRQEDCPICCLPLPLMQTGSKYKLCCGKVICCGCIHAIAKAAGGRGNDLCPFCRASTPKKGDLQLIAKRNQQRIEKNDVRALHGQGISYYFGERGCRRDWSKAFQYWNRAGELGYAPSYGNIAAAYCSGELVGQNYFKMMHYMQLAAGLGDIPAAACLGISEELAGNMNRAVRHHMIAAGGGDDNSLQRIRELYIHKHATKEAYVKALRTHQAYLDGIRSIERDAAAAFSDEYKYHGSNVWYKQKKIPNEALVKKILKDNLVERQQGN